MLAINKHQIQARLLDKFRQLDWLNRLNHLYMPMATTNHLDIWLLEHKYSQIHNTAVSFYHKYISLSLAAALPWFDMNKEYFWTQVPVFT
jgi:hypothetical protein